MVGFGQGLVVRAMTGAVRWRVLLLANAVFAASFLVLLGASRLSIGLATTVVLVGSVVYTMGELLGGPVHGALSAEAAPEHLRGRYLSLIQFAWNVAGTISPIAFAWLLDRGSSPIWFGLFAVSAAGALLAARLGVVMPHAAARVTNTAADAPDAGPPDAGPLQSKTVDMNDPIQECQCESEYSPEAGTAPD